MPGPGFAVIDFETTGLFPGGHDRVIEVAVVHTDAHGLVTGQWETLVNPGRDLGRQDIHRIRAADTLDAPRFEEIAGELLDLLSGRVLVAHNADFDTRFLFAELERIDRAPWGSVPCLCTMQLARDFLPGAGRTLADCCSAYDIELVDAHRAAADALATARLLEAYILSAPTWDGWNQQLAAAIKTPWPSVSARAPWKPRPETAEAPSAASFLARITLKMPEFSGPAEQLDYLALLDRALLDRHLSAHEANALVTLAEQSGIDRHTCARLHLEYFEALTTVAWEDGVLTEAEIEDLLTVADLLDVPTDMVALAVQDDRRSVPQEQAHDGPATNLPAGEGFVPGAFRLDPGDLIVLTGEMVRPRAEWHAELSDRGFVPWDAVTKKVKLLVAADPDSLSGKARKARDYGITVVGEAALASLLT